MHKTECVSEWSVVGVCATPVSDHILHVLDCQLGCEGNLSSVYTVPIENFLPEQFHYLQYAYYKCKCWM